MSRQGVSASAFYFYGWNSCNTDAHPDWSSDIASAWDEVQSLRAAVSNWDRDQAGDFFGNKANNNNQTQINNILKNIQIWKNDGTVLAWSMQARCDD
jgi:hypothetical protein